MNKIRCTILLVYASVYILFFPCKICKLIHSLDFLFEFKIKCRIYFFISSGYQGSRIKKGYHFVFSIWFYVIECQSFFSIKGINAERKEAKAEKEEAEKYQKLTQDLVSCLVIQLQNDECTTFLYHSILSTLAKWNGYQ